MKRLTILCLVSLLIPVQAVFADFWAERSALAAVEKELESIEKLVMVAKAQSDPSNRTTFEYEVLLSDLRNIRSGIRDHLTVPMEPVVPSTIDAVRGTYTEHQK